MASNEETNAAGTDTRPPMLVESDYDSWKIRIHRYIRGKPNGKQIWKSIQKWHLTASPMITDPPPSPDSVLCATPRRNLILNLVKRKTNLRWLILKLKSFLVKVFPDTSSTTSIKQALQRRFGIMWRCFIEQGSVGLVRPKGRKIFFEWNGTPFVSIGNENQIHDILCAFPSTSLSILISKPMTSMPKRLSKNQEQSTIHQPTAQSPNDGFDVHNDCRLLNTLKWFPKASFPPPTNQLPDFPPTSNSSCCYSRQEVICYKQTAEKGHVPRQCTDNTKHVSSQSRGMHMTQTDDGPKLAVAFIYGQLVSTMQPTIQSMRRCHQEEHKDSAAETEIDTITMPSKNPPSSDVQQNLCLKEPLQESSSLPVKMRIARKGRVSKGISGSTDFLMVSGFLMLKTIDLDPLHVYQTLLEKFIGTVRFGNDEYALSLAMKKPNLQYFRVFGSLCYPTNDYDDVGKLKAKADICKCRLCTPPERRTDLNNKRSAARVRKPFMFCASTELTEGLTSVQTSSGLAPQQMTSVTNSTELELTALQSGRSRSALVKDPEPPSVPPTKKQVDDLFQWFDDDDEVIPIPPVVPITPVNVPLPRQPEKAQWFTPYNHIIVRRRSCSY
ncbi:hypothetical protein Tco_0471423 [Tanacetum coccineum]